MQQTPHADCPAAQLNSAGCWHSGPPVQNSCADQVHISQPHVLQPQGCLAEFFCTSKLLAHYCMVKQCLLPPRPSSHRHGSRSCNLLEHQCSSHQLSVRVQPFSSLWRPAPWCLGATAPTHPPQRRLQQLVKSVSSVTGMKTRRWSILHLQRLQHEPCRYVLETRLKGFPGFGCKSWTCVTQWRLWIVSSTTPGC